VHVPARPTKVLIDGQEREFQYDPAGHSATFLVYYPDGPRAKPAAGSLREVQVLLQY